MAKNKYSLLYLIGAIAVIAIIIVILQRPETSSVSGGSRADLALGVTTPGSNDIGDFAPDFRLETTTGEVLQLSQFRGKKAVLVNFWATWCPFCLDEFPDFQEVYAPNQDKLEILAVNLQESDVAKQQRFADELGTTFPLLLDPNADVKKAYNVFTQPVSYFIDINLDRLATEEATAESASIITRKTAYEVIR